MKVLGVFSTKQKAQDAKDFEGLGYLNIAKIEVDLYDAILNSIPSGQKLFEIQIFKTGKIRSINKIKEYETVRNVFQKCNQYISRKKSEKKHCKIILTAKGQLPLD